MIEGVGRLLRKVCPLLVVGMGICIVREKNRRCRAKMRRMEQRQEEALQTLREIRDSLKGKCSQSAGTP